MVQRHHLHEFDYQFRQRRFDQKNHWMRQQWSESDNRKLRNKISEMGDTAKDYRWIISYKIQQIEAWRGVMSRISQNENGKIASSTIKVVKEKKSQYIYIYMSAYIDMEISLHQWFHRFTNLIFLLNVVSEPFDSYIPHLRWWQE